MSAKPGAAVRGVPPQSFPPMTFTVDVEDIGGDGRRYRGMTQILLDFLEQRGISGTFFIEDSVAVSAAGLVRDIARRGHEVGSHSYRHLDLTAETRTTLAAGMGPAKARLEAITGVAVLGFRAPRFSLVPSSAWAADVLGEAGFIYSSSVVPGRWFPNGFPGAPETPFVWPSGLLEIPCPVARVGPLRLPFLGGMNMRYTPPWRFRWFLRELEGQTCWTYCHPYDIDAEAPYARLPGLGRFSSLMLWLNRAVTLRRWAMLAANPAPRFADRLGELRRGAPVFDGRTVRACVAAE